MHSFFLCGLLASALLLVNARDLPPVFEPHGLDAGSLEQFKKDFLDAHNKYRAAHGVPAMKLNETLSSLAQREAEYFILSGMFPGPHSVLNFWSIYCQKTIFHDTCPDERFGTHKFDGARPVHDWYIGHSNNAKWYSGEPDMEHIHRSRTFTHLVRKENTDVGVGIAKVHRRTLVVGLYHPIDYEDYPKKFTENVLAPIA